MIELLIAVAILGALTLVALPAFNEMIRSNRLTSTTNQLVGSLSLARSEAVKQGRSVTVCQRIESGDESCETDGSKAGAWAKGWVGYVGTLDGTPDPDSADDVFQLKEALKGDTTLSVTDQSTGDATNFITFSSNGRANRRTGFTLCDPKLGKSKEITISNTGRIRSQDGTCPITVAMGGEGNSLTRGEGLC